MLGTAEFILIKEQNEILRSQIIFLKEQVTLLEEQNNMLRHFSEDLFGWLKQIDRDIRDKWFFHLFPVGIPTGFSFTLFKSFFPKYTT